MTAGSTGTASRSRFGGAFRCQGPFVGASVVAAFIVIGAVGAAVQGSLALRDWSCRLGWTTSYCTLPGPATPRPVDIPA